MAAPHNLEAEESLLGALLVDDSRVAEVRRVLQPAEFYREAHALTYGAILALHERGEPVDIVTVSEELERSGDLERVGGRTFLSGLHSPTSAHALTYAKTIARKARSRHFLEAAGEIVALAQSEDEDIADRAQLILVSRAMQAYEEGAAKFARKGLGYVGTFPPRVILEVHGLRWSGGELHGELHVVVGGIPVHRARFNLSSTSARSTLAKSLQGRTSTKVDWLRCLEDLCQHVLGEERRGEPFEKVGKRPPRPGNRYLMSPFMPVDQPTLLFADGGTGKSYLAVAVAVSVQIGRPLVPGFDLHKKGNVLYLDWETSRDEIDERIKAVCAGAGVEPVEFFYRRCSASLTDMVEEVAGLIATEGIVLVIVDSLGYALGEPGQRGGQEETAIRFFTAVRHLKTTVLGIDHVTKEGAGNAGGAGKPYGSAYKVNYARSAWEMRRQGDVDGEVVLIHRKANNSRRAAPVGLRAEFTENEEGLTTKVAYSALEITDPVQMTMANKTAYLDEFVNAHPNGITTSQIIEQTGLTDSQVSGLLKRLAETGRVEKRGRGLWGPATGTPEAAESRE